MPASLAQMLGRKARFDDYEVDFARRELRKAGTRVSLQHKPFRVLELLLRHPGELVKREELFDFLWPDSHVSFEHGLNTAVNSLRHALGESSRESRFIETRPGLGYRFIATVEQVTESDPKAAPPSDSGKSDEAYADYLKGRYFLDRMAGEEDLYRAIAFFNSAAANERCCPLAHAGIADAYCQLALVGSVAPSKVACQARSSAAIALSRAPDLADAHVSVGRVKMFFDWDWQGARQSVSRALELDVNSVSVHILHASLLVALGSFGEALQVCRRAVALDPMSFPANLQFAACLYAVRDFKEAIDQCWKMLTLRSRFAPAQMLLALAYVQLGMHEEAVIEFQNARQCAGFQAAATSGLGQVFAAAGLEREAEQVFLELSKQAQDGYLSSYWLAVVSAARGQRSSALSFLEESLRQLDPLMLGLKADARFDSIREHERFQIVLRRLDIQNIENHLQ